jgi:hypothetical protein
MATKFVLFIERVFIIFIKRNILSPEMSVACLWSVESGRFMCLSTFGHVPICIYMSYRPIEQSVPKPLSKQGVSAVYGVSDQSLHW